MEQDLSYFRDFGEQIEQRLDKLQNFAERGQAAYPPRVIRNHTAAEAITLYDEAEAALPEGSEEKPEITVQVAGRLVAIRIMGKSTFAHIEDGTGRIQIYLRKNDLDDSYDVFKKDVDLGDFIAVQGHLFRTRTGEVTVHADAYQLAAKALHPLPEKWHGLTDIEIRYRRRYLDLISNSEIRDIFRKRSQAISAMRKFLDNEGFLEVETPTLQPIYGGAMARPFTTHHNALDMQLYLRISDELYLKRLIVGGLDKVYEICKDFRNEGISTKHNPEFTMMECYWAYADYEDMMRLTENMIASIAQEVLGTTKITFNGQEVDLTPPWRRLNLAEGIKAQTGIDIFDTYSDVKALWEECQRRNLKVTPQPSWGKLVDELLGEYVEPTIVNPTFIHTFPLDISPLAKQSPSDPRVVERFEAFVVGMEIGNAYSELNDPVAQRQRFLEQQQIADAESHAMDEDYVLALMQGMPPTGGLGIGVDRVVMLLTDQQSIREVILFPHMRSKE
ncbi:MAG TPA: lysine--tRNA ligase [Anaerolineae bacterium]|nr:lysine--tRNA ligase [Anaerolineales bacterium]HRV96629.1 lysine--tRNA ligase [Anaerolineae bacterium]